jgi:hypothetical protein
MLIQYWDGLDKLYAYAAERDAEHWPAWRRFNRLATRATDVAGILGLRAAFGLQVRAHDHLGGTTWRWTRRNWSRWTPTFRT